MLTMTVEYAHSIATDAANRSMRKGWPRKAWNDEDCRAYSDALTRCRALELAYPWASPEQVAQMQRDLGYDTRAERPS